jgi:aromatic ring-opening dioxygenase catalytic subunit (LigB family)
LFAARAAQVPRVFKGDPMTNSRRLPVLFIPHGGGPWHVMPQPPVESGRSWKPLGDFLSSIDASLGHRPKAILVISGHWDDEAVPTVSTSTAPGMLFDYYGFPDNTYKIQYAAKGSPEVATRVRELLSAAGIASAENKDRGFDHGVFVPLMMAYPDADVPVVMLSLQRNLDAADHIRIGKALTPLRDEDVLIITSGMSYHNMRMFGSEAPAHVQQAIRFDGWLKDAVAKPEQKDREATLIGWESNADAVACHYPGSEHLTPLFVAEGASDGDIGSPIFTGSFLGKPYSAFRFG